MQALGQLFWTCIGLRVHAKANSGLDRIHVQAITDQAGQAGLKQDYMCRLLPTTDVQSCLSMEGQLIIEENVSGFRIHDEFPSTYQC